MVEETARALAAQAAAGRPLVVMNAPFGLTLLDRELRRHRSASLADYLGGRSLCVLDPRVLDAHLDGSPAGRSTLAELCARYGVLRTGPHGAEEQAEPGREAEAEAYADGDGDGEPRAAGAGRPADDRCTRADASWEAGLCTHGDPHAHPSARADPCAQADPCARAVAEAEAALAVLRALGPRFAARTGPLSAAELHARQAVWHAARARGLGSWFAGSGSAEPVDPAWPLRPRLPAAA
ncbi:hypothetical protein [Streptomyces sp. Ru87]|uniref:hypothetical protein n=1 Tax=Streptomyces sp. Ru87 TaxID=2044307 RepID=UPI00211D3A23|nr:hypothetical protein [Streptomyces sp. Ru87]